MWRWIKQKSPSNTFSDTSQYKHAFSTKSQNITAYESKKKKRYEGASKSNIHFERECVWGWERERERILLSNIQEIQFDFDSNKFKKEEKYYKDEDEERYIPGHMSIS